MCTTIEIKKGEISTKGRCLFGTRTRTSIVYRGAWACTCSCAVFCWTGHTYCKPNPLLGTQQRAPHSCLVTPMCMALHPPDSRPINRLATRCILQRAFLFVHPSVAPCAVRDPAGALVSVKTSRELATATMSPGYSWVASRPKRRGRETHLAAVLAAAAAAAVRVATDVDSRGAALAAAPPCAWMAAGHPRALGDEG